VLIECNAWTLPQERYNAEWVVEKQVGIVLNSFRDDVVSGVQQMLQPERLVKFKENVQALHNRAVFEIPEILSKLLGESATSHSNSSQNDRTGDSVPTVR